MPDFELKASDRHLTSHTGLALIGQCCEVAEVNGLAAAFPMTRKIHITDMVKSDVSPLALEKRDFEVIEPFRADQLFQEDMSIGRVPSSVWLR